MREKRSRNPRSKCLWESYLHAREYSTQIKCIGIYGYLKEKSNLMIFDRHTHLKYRYGNRKFGVDFTKYEQKYFLHLL